VIKDRSRCRARGETYKIVLLANIGPTFVGGRDDLIGLCKALRKIRAEISYIHANGALDFGFSSNGVCLGHPSITEKNGVPVVQGITLNHHKAYGIMASGELICYSPTDETEKPAKAVFSIDPRAVFETCLFQRLYSPTHLARLSRCCLDNANRLRRLLQAKNEATLFNSKCMITLIERLPPWMIKEFHLAPEGDWTHYITMPHIAPTTVDDFVQTIALLDVQFAKTCAHIRPVLNFALDRTLTLKRVRYHDKLLFPKMVFLAKRRLVDSSSGEQNGSTIWLDTFKRQFVYGSMSSAVVDVDNEPLVVFLTEASESRVLSPGPVLLNHQISCKMHVMQDIASQPLFMFQGY